MMHDQKICCLSKDLVQLRQTVELTDRIRQERRRDLIFSVRHGRDVVVADGRNSALFCLQDCSCYSDGLNGMSVIHQDLPIVQGVLSICLPSSNISKLKWPI